LFWLAVAGVMTTVPAALAVPMASGEASTATVDPMTTAADPQRLARRDPVGLTFIRVLSDT
jgi:hypothetical protein